MHSLITDLQGRDHPAGSKPLHVTCIIRVLGGGLERAIRGIHVALQRAVAEGGLVGVPHLGSRAARSGSDSWRVVPTVVKGLDLQQIISTHNDLLDPSSSRWWST